MISIISQRIAPYFIIHTLKYYKTHIESQQKPDHNLLYDLVSLTDTSETSEQQQVTPQGGHNT